MANERRGDRRQGRPGGGGGGGGYGEFRPHRGRPPRSGPPRGGFGEEAPRDFAPRQGRAPYPARTGGGYAPRGAGDEGGMAIRVDPRRLSLLKELAAGEGLRPGQLVQRWVEERLDAERSGRPMAGASPAGPRVAELESTLAAISARIDEVTRRLQAIESGGGDAAGSRMTTERAGTGEPSARRRGRPPKGSRAQAAAARSARAAASRDGHVGLHDEIIAVIRERGPSTAAELASAIRERGRYQPPRSAKPLDAATVNSRVSNPVYRARFRRAEGRIGLAE
jgi:hypothetical protein